MCWKASNKVRHAFVLSISLPLVSTSFGLNADPKIHGILVQLPLPAHIDAHKILEAIALEKDVEGFHVNKPVLSRQCQAAWVR